MPGNASLLVSYKPLDNLGYRGASQPGKLESCHCPVVSRGASVRESLTPSLRCELKVSGRIHASVPQITAWVIAAT